MRFSSFIGLSGSKAGTPSASEGAGKMVSAFMDVPFFGMNHGAQGGQTRQRRQFASLYKVLYAMISDL
jgi:hypothetical protein